MQQAPQPRRVPIRLALAAARGQFGGGRDQAGVRAATWRVERGRVLVYDSGACRDHSRSRDASVSDDGRIRVRSLGEDGPVVIGFGRSSDRAVVGNSRSWRLFEESTTSIS